MPGCEVSRCTPLPPGRARQRSLASAHAIRSGPTAGAPPRAAGWTCSTRGAAGRARPATPIHPIAQTAPPGAARRAAAVQAAYASLVLLYPPATFPSIKTALDLRRAVSLTALSTDPQESAASVAAGLAWGQTVAEAIV